MQRLFERHRDAEAARDIEAILATFVEDCFLETHPSRPAQRGTGGGAEGLSQLLRGLSRSGAPQTEAGEAFGDDAMVIWARLEGTSGGEWIGMPTALRGAPYADPLPNVTPFRDGLMAGESMYFDLATLCAQAALPLDQVRAGARERAEALRSPDRRMIPKPSKPPGCGSLGAGSLSISA